MASDHITDAMVEAALDTFVDDLGTNWRNHPLASDYRKFMRAALLAAAREAWQPTHRHRKGSLYRVVTRGRIEADLTPAVIYDDAEGNTWVRPASEFDDGRFAALPPPEPSHD